MANYHMQSLRDKTIPVHPEKLLFCVDLVKFVISIGWPDEEPKPHNVNGCERYRDTIYNAFTGDIKKATEFYTERHKEEVEQKFLEYVQNNKEVTVDSFNDYAKEYETAYFVKKDTFNFRNLMKFAVCVSLVAGHYYYKGVTEVLETAANFILFKFPEDTFMNSHYWDALSAVCSEVIGIKEEEIEEPPVDLIDYQEH